MYDTILPHPFKETLLAKNSPDPCILVIFGVTGDLTARKLMPALFNLFREGLLPSNFVCVGFARRDKSSESFRSEMKEQVGAFSRHKSQIDSLWPGFEKHLFYHQSEFDDQEGYKKLKSYLDTLDKEYGTQGNRVYYLSTQPSFFPGIIENLSKGGLIYNEPEEECGKWSRVIIEKPFGRDLSTALELHHHVSKFLKEDQIFRIDHYLGKETVQNLLVFRFANSIFESIWNNQHIDHIQITVGEDIGIGTRGRFWEENGMLRDIVQNHIMQILSLVAMEPPVNLEANSIRDEKVKVLESLRVYNEAEIVDYVIRGQYAQGYIAGKEVNGYRKEENVAPNSPVETYTALEVYIDNWRWSGVPFFIRAGKRLPKKATEIAIKFKDVPGYLFRDSGPRVDTNVLTIRIQPDEGIALKINCKIPGLNGPIQPVKMDFRYGSYFGSAPPEAYERLICDCILGDSTLFARADEVLASWKFCSPILDFWGSQKPTHFPNYSAGTWGPHQANELLLRTRRAWRLI